MNRQNGNVLFLILIAVALFAALSYAVTQSERGGGADTKNENIQILAAQYMDYGATLKVAVDRMIASGISADQIQLLNVTVACTSGPNCLFGPAGGGAIESKLKYDPDLDQYGAFFWGYRDVPNGLTVDGIGTSAPDIVLDETFKYGDKGKRLCEALNKAVGVVGIPTTGPYVPNNYNAVFGAPILCFDYTYGSYYIFYYVLHAN